MDAKNRKKILVALDGSDHSFNAVHYLARVLPRNTATIVLFSVYTKRPERFWDTEEDPFIDPNADDGRLWEIEHKRAIGEFLENARKTLLKYGFSPDDLVIKSQEKQIGIARDIIREAQSGYDAVVVGRQGMNPITRLVIGSVAAKLIAGLTTVPLWLMGTEVIFDSSAPLKLLVTIDGSDNALRAVKYVGEMTAGADIDITLFQVIRSFDFRLPGPDEHFFAPPEGAKWTEESREAHVVRAAFEKAVKILADTGFDHRRITTKIVSGVATRSGTIIAQAMTGGYGTIVIGRRGHSRVGEFHMGRVTNKVIQLAGKTTVWMIS